MGHLSLVKSLSHFREERKYSEEILLEPLGLALPRGTITEFTGEASSGRTSLVLNILSKQTREGEVCAVVDASGSFDPRSAKLAGVVLENLFWVKCDGDIEKAFTAADYLVQAKGFGVIWLNLAGLPRQKLKMVPRTYWYRYRNRIKQTPTVLIVTAPDPVAGTASHQSFLLSRRKTVWSGRGRFKLLREFQLTFHSRKQFRGASRPLKIDFDYSDV